MKDTPRALMRIIRIVETDKVSMGEEMVLLLSERDDQ